MGEAMSNRPNTYTRAQPPPVRPMDRHMSQRDLVMKSLLLRPQPTGKPGKA
jgi:hypothetical protein